MLTITNTDSSFTVTAREAIDLELKLNVTSKGREWVKLGDHLYAFGTKQPCSNVLVVTNDQFAFLKILGTYASYRDCTSL